MKKMQKSSMAWLGMLAVLSTANAFAASNLCKGQTVYGNDGHELVGRIVAVFGEKAKVRWSLMDGDSYSGDDYWDVDSLAAQVPCLEQFCKNSVVYANNDHDLVGTVQRVFDNGKVEINWSAQDGQPYSDRLDYWDVEALSLETRCSSGICEGDEVYENNGHDLVGKVQRVFSNDKAEVKWTEQDGAAYNNWPSYWDISSLTKETGCSTGGKSRCHHRRLRR
jgi:hypothetical protein